MPTSVTVPAGPMLGDTSVIFTFNGDYQTGQFCNGDWWVVGGAGRTITAISPACQVNVAGGYTNNASTYTDRTINGAMINFGCATDALGVLDTNANPYGRGAQGYDSCVGAPGYANSYAYYTDALNVDPALPGNGPISMATAISITKAVCIPTTERAARPANSDIVILTVLLSVPAAGSFRPAPARADKTILYNKSALRYDILPHLDRTLVPSRPTLANALIAVQRYSQFGNSNLLGSRNTCGLNNDGAPYGQFYAQRWDLAYLTLCMDYTQAELEPIYIAIVQKGIDIAWRALEGNVIFPDNGGGGTVKFPVVLLALLFPTTDFLRIADRAQSLIFLEDRQVFTVSSVHVATPSDYQPLYASNNGALGYQVGDILTDASTVFDGYVRGQCRVTNVCSNGIIGNPANGSVAENPGFGGLIGIANTGDYNITPSGAVPYSGGSGSGLQLTLTRHFDRYYPSLIGTPDWGASYTKGGNNPDGSNWDVAYRNICSYMYSGAVLAARLITGAMAAWNNPVLFEYVDRAMDMLGAPNPFDQVARGNGPTQLQYDAYTAYRNLSAGPAANFVEAAASGVSAWLRYDLTLSRRTPPAFSAFTVVETIGGTPTPHTIIGIEVYGRSARLITSVAFGAGNAVAITYTPPSTNALRDVNGHLLPAFGVNLITRAGCRRYARGWLK